MEAAGEVRLAPQPSTDRKASAIVDDNTSSEKTLKENCSHARALMLVPLVQLVHFTALGEKYASTDFFI